MLVTRQFISESNVHLLNQKCLRIVSLLRISMTVCSEPHLLNIFTSTHIKLLNTCYNTTDITFLTLLTVSKIFSYKIKHGRTEIRMGSNVWFLFQYTQKGYVKLHIFRRSVLKKYYSSPDRIACIAPTSEVRRLLRLK